MVEALVADLEKLNEQQRKIVRGLTGPALVLAGPGTGKTRTIAVLLGKLLDEGLRMKECLALSFSDKAATELRERVLSYYPYGFDECWISTFHSFCARMLREQFYRVGIHPEFQLLTGFKEALLFRGLVARLDPAAFPVFGPVLHKRGFQQEVLTFIALLKSNLVSPDDLAAVLPEDSGAGAADRADRAPEPGAGPAFSPRVLARLRELLALYRAYEAEREKGHYLDFRDLIRLAVQVLADPEAARFYREKFKVVLIDEFQDTDPAQFHLLSLLLEGVDKPRVMVIGDPRQSIYRFRGANPGMMGKDGAFRQRFKARVFPLGINYRNAPVILAAAQRLAWRDRSAGRSSERGGGAGSGEEVLEARSGRMGFVEVHAAADELAEARFVARRVASLLIYGAHRRFAPDEVAILVRNNYQIDLLSEALRALHVPFRIAADMKFFRSEEVTTLISLLKAAGTEGEAREEALRRAFASPLFHLDPLWVQSTLAEVSGAGGLDPFLDRFLDQVAVTGPTSAEPAPSPAPLGRSEADASVAVSPGSAGSAAGEAETVRRAAGFAETWRMLRAAGDLPVTTVLARLLLTVRESLVDPAAPAARHVFLLRTMVADFAEVWARQHGSEPRLRDLLPNLDEMLTYFASTLEETGEEMDGGVRVMTVHQSKGLEFPVVFVVGLSEGVFPVAMREDRLLPAGGLNILQARLDARRPAVSFYNPYPSDAEDHLEEERRLFFVAMTRAQEGLVLTWPQRVGHDPVSPAPFLREIGLEPQAAATDERPLSLSEARVRLAALSEADRAALEKLWREQHPADEGAARFFERLRPAPPPPPAVDQVRLPADFRFTASALQAYLECPRRFFFKHVLRVRDPREAADPSLALGRALHACLEALHADGSPWAHGVRPPPAALDELWERHGEPELAYLGPLARAGRRALARQSLDWYVAAVYEHGQVPFGERPLVEAGFEFACAGFRCAGRFDRVVETPDGQGTWIIDYKTTSTTRSSENLLEQVLPEEGGLAREIQMPFYLLAARHLASLRVRRPPVEGAEAVAGSANATAVQVPARLDRPAVVTLYLRKEPYAKGRRPMQAGFLRSAALNLGGGPAWGCPVDPERFARFEADLAALLQRIASDRTFDCRPLDVEGASTCLRRACEFVSFCQERLAFLKDRSFDDLSGEAEPGAAPVAAAEAD